VPDEKEEDDYDDLKCGAEEDGGESYPTLSKLKVNFETDPTYNSMLLLM
jgi:hypothetical protein